jgi:hypothetical protein
LRAALFGMRTTRPLYKSLLTQFPVSTISVLINEISIASPRFADLDSVTCLVQVQGADRHPSRKLMRDIVHAGLPIVCKAYATLPAHNNQHKSLHESHIQGHATHAEFTVHHCSANGSSDGNQLAATQSAFFSHPQLTDATL